MNFYLGVTAGFVVTWALLIAQDVSITWHSGNGSTTFNNWSRSTSAEIKTNIKVECIDGKPYFSNVNVDLGKGATISFEKLNAAFDCQQRQIAP